MKVVILAGGFGTRISEETHLKPKPMIEIGGKPMLWHIMKEYSSHGINDFVICCGYKGYMVKEYFANYFLHMSDVTFDMKNNKMEVHRKSAEPWTVTLVDTGLNTMTGGRLKKIKEYVNDETPPLTDVSNNDTTVEVSATNYLNQRDRINESILTKMTVNQLKTYIKDNKLKIKLTQKKDALVKSIINNK